MAKNVRAVKRLTERKPVIVQEAVHAFCTTAAFRQVAETTQDNYTHFLSVFSHWCGAHTLIQDRTGWKAAEVKSVHEAIMLHQVDEQAVHCFLEHLQKNHKPAKASRTELATWTLATYVKCIKALLNWCLLDDEYSQHVLAVTIQRIKKPKVEQEIIETFSAKEIAALFKACDQEMSEHLQLRDRAILALLLDSGIRSSELVTLTLGNISLDTKDAYVRVLGKGRKWGEVGLGEQAQRALRKYIRLYREPTIEYAFNQQHLNLSERQKAIERKRMMEQATVFVNRYGQPLTRSGLQQIIDRLAEWAGIEGIRCSPHSFRHTMAALFIRNGGDIYTLSKLLRHTSVSVTEEYLRSLQQSEARKGAASVLDTLQGRK